MKVFYRADGNAEIGTGHLLRGILIQRELERTGGAEVVFCSRDYAWARRRLEAAGCAVVWLPPGLEEAEEVLEVRRRAAESRADLAVSDVLDTSRDPDLCTALGSGGRPVVTFDDTGAGRLGARAIIDFLVRDPAPEAVRVRGVALYEGPEYATLVPEYEGANRIPHPIALQARRLLISLGGGDAAGLTLKVVSALSHCRTLFEATVIVGSAYPHRARLDALASMAPVPVTVRQNVPSLLEEFRGAEMAVVAGGLTMHEALAVGTPSLTLSQAVWHQEFLASLWAAAGVMVNLGAGDEAREESIAVELDTLATDPDRRRSMSRAGQRYVDGCGTRRVVQLLMGMV